MTHVLGSWSTVVTRASAGRPHATTTNKHQRQW
jgi:hypothetical protein